MRTHLFCFYCSLHIRRTDKIIEAKYIELDKYMQHVIHWYGNYTKAVGKNVERNVFLATDEISVYVEALKR